MPTTDQKSSNRMERRKRRTRHDLMDAACQLILKDGYEDVMTDQITELADVGRRTFYNHFVNKRSCVLAAVKEKYAGFAMNMADTASQHHGTDSDADPAAVILKMACGMFDLIASDPLTKRLIHYPRILSEAVEESQRDFITANIADGVVKGRFNPSLAAESLEPIFVWGFVGLVVTAIPRKSQQEDALGWGHFVLQNLGINEKEAIELVDTLAAKRGHQ